VYSFSDGPSNRIPFTSLSVVSRDGKLLSAAAVSCTWQFIFFSSADPELVRQYDAYMKARHAKLEQSRLERLEAEAQKFYAEASASTDQKLLERYGLGKRGLSAVSRNPLGVTLRFSDDGSLTITLIGEPDLVKTIARPSR
jgi:hypothetical protein